MTITGLDTSSPSATARSYPASGRDRQPDMTGIGGGTGSGTLALEVQPTGAVTRTADGTVESEHADALQVLTEVEAAAVLGDAPEGVNTVFPYGFVVRNPNEPGDRTLPAGPGPEEFDGVVTFAFKIPLQTTSADDPFEVRAVFLAVDDSEIRLTESPQERTPAGEAAIAARADELAAGGAPVTVRLLADRPDDVLDGYSVRRVCGVRTAGIDPESPLAVLDDSADCTPCAAVPRILRVDGDAPPGGDGTSWGNAFGTLQDALDYLRGQADVECSPTLRNLTFSGTPDVALFFIVSPSTGRAAPLIEDVAFTGNRSGMFAESVQGGRASPTFVRATFAGNELGGFSATGRVHAEFYRTTFRDNDDTAVTLGFTHYPSESGAEFYNSTFLDNVSADGGGAVHALGGSVLVVNSVFQGNRTDGAGGAMLFGDGAAVSLVNVTIAGNEAGDVGGGLATATEADVTLELANVVLWENIPDGINPPGFLPPILEFADGSSMRNSVVQGGCMNAFDCSDVLDQDPLFVDAAAGDLRLQALSPAVDAGDNAALPEDRPDLDADGDTAESLPVDLDGNPRVVDATGLGVPFVDMGAYEK